MWNIQKFVFPGMYHFVTQEQCPERNEELQKIQFTPLVLFFA